jgi:hypothetical protein
MFRRLFLEHDPENVCDEEKTQRKTFLSADPCSSFFDALIMGPRKHLAENFRLVLPDTQISTASSRSGRIPASRLFVLCGGISSRLDRALRLTSCNLALVLRRTSHGGLLGMQKHLHAISLVLDQVKRWRCGLMWLDAALQLVSGRIPSELSGVY